MSSLATDNFNRANGALGANWSHAPGSVAPSTIDTNQDIITAGGLGGNVHGDYYNAVSAPNDQYSSVLHVTIHTVSDEGRGPAVRINTSSGFTGYFTQENTTESKLYLANANSFTQLGADGSAATAGQRIETRAVGTAISSYRNSVLLVGPITDATLSAGQFGMWGYGGGIVDDWEGGDFAGGGVAVKTRKSLLGVGI